jgi:hypothetical protein
MSGSGADGPAGGTSGRRRRRLIGAGLAGAAVAAAVITAAVSTTGPARTPASSTPVTQAGQPSGPRPASSRPTTPTRQGRLAVGLAFGDSLAALTPSALGRALDDVVALHMTWIRVDMSWARLQPHSATGFEWTATDAIVGAARHRHLHVLGLLGYTPAWARASGCRSFVCPPRSPAAFAQYAAAVAARYRGSAVAAYQVWNEPNIAQFWASPDPEAYGLLLADTTAALRRADPRALIVFGGLAVTGTTGSAVAAGTFLTRSCAARPCRVDAVGYDPYTYPALPSSATRPPNGWQQMSELRAAMAAAGLAAVPIWVTQFGAPTDYPGGSDPRLVSDTQQARILLDGLRLAAPASSGIGALFVNTWRDSATRGSREDHFGIENADGTRKPAFAALARALAS